MASNFASIGQTLLPAETFTLMRRAPDRQYCKKAMRVVDDVSFSRPCHFGDVGLRIRRSGTGKLRPVLGLHVQKGIVCRLGGRLSPRSIAIETVWTCRRWASPTMPRILKTHGI